MRRALQLLLASLALVSLMSLIDAGPLNLMSAPNLLRVGTAENIFVECQDCTGVDQVVTISVKNHPTKTRTLATTQVTLTNAKNFQDFGQITIPPGEFSKDPTAKQYVYLEAAFPGETLEKVVMVSFQSGYIFIQTDKTLYTPNSKVYYRMFGLTPRMEPVERVNDAQTDTSISIEIVTPEGIILPLEPVSLKSGIHSGHYQLNELFSPGLWKIMVKFQNSPQESFSANFEVKEYVLPSFEVKLSSLRPFFYVDSETLEINIKARYLFGQEVNGNAYVVFGIIDQGQKKSFPDSLSRVPIENGEGNVELKREQITKTFSDINQLVGSSIFVSVSVLTDSGSEMVEAELRGIQVVTSPYTITFKRTPKYFKPGMSFDVVVEVLNPDESPAENIPVVVTPGPVRGITAANGMARLTINTVTQAGGLSISAKTNDPNISPTRQAEATMEAKQYTTNSKTYIHIGVGTPEVKLGDNLKIDLFLNNKPSGTKDITCLITSRGQLVKFERYKSKGQSLISLTITVTKEMLPSFRILAFYHHTDNEVVSDSVWVDVKDSCMGSLTLEPTRPGVPNEPRKMFGLKVSGDPGATVGLVAVDKGVYVLNSKHRLTQKKIWDEVEKYDTGCTPGGGKDGLSVFYDAGLLFESSTASGTANRREVKCAAPSRRRRASTIMDVRTTLLSQYKEDLQRDCCLDGMKNSPVSYTCERRSEYIVDGQACVDAFLTCCKEMEKQQLEQKEESLHLARSETDESYMDSNDIVTRSNFPESWLWNDIILPECPKNTPNCDSTSTLRDVPLQDSITTWEFTGISLSRTHGICVGEPLEVIVRKDFFIDLRLPYSAVRGEQLEIKAILHNYRPEIITVRIDLAEENDVCSAAFKRGKYRQEVQVGKMSTRSVPFIIIPMKEGTLPIKVKAAVKDSSLSDGVEKSLRVVPPGVLVKALETVTLDPAHKDGEQVEVLNSNISERNLIPNSPTSTEISVTGREQVSGLVENAISGKSMGTLIYQPSGCGEQNMIHMTLPVIATTYLDKTNQWEAVGFQKRPEALQHIKTGYNNELAYLKSDGSFAVYPRTSSSTWLTAYVVKVFSMANNLVGIKKEHICDAVKFLILKAQQPDGMFTEVGRVSAIYMTGDVFGSNSDASMTAFCLIAMQESRTLCSAAVNTLPGSISNAVAYLEKRLPSLTNPYAVAMTSYALANEGKLNREILNKFISPDLSHWPIPGRPILTLEATAYALLALVKTKSFEDARPVVRWFNQQQTVGGGFGSTQATIIVYQAIAEYWTNAQEPEYDLKVDILLPGKSKPDKYEFNRDNSYATRTSRIKDINKDVKVKATGSGEAVVKMVSLYYALPQEKESDCQKFDVSVQLLPDKNIGDTKVYKLQIEVLYKDSERDATMSILDIGLLTGFTPNQDDLKALSEGHARIISKFEMDTALSEKGSLIIYLDKVSHTRPEEISFRLQETIPVGVLQPAAVSVYEYYEQTPCVKFYHPEREAGQLKQLCRGDVCKCAEENCSMQRKGQINNDERTTKICESTETSKIEYAYKVLVEEVDYKQSKDTYTMRVQDSIKEGSTDVGPMGKLRIFFSYPHCREALNLVKGKTYLIMGSSGDIYRDEKQQIYEYGLGERTWIEYWPTAEECQGDEHRDTCLGLDEMLEQYRVFACQQ
ncbi:complement C3 isoform X2 [Oryzias melastigma]|uniref:complement C3 isoform X2 n=1 Tax=Oryzias melastigma TaxID=30732 RepID=UPI00168CBF91|nr:complement C3 isoform X2 [Oryzias melastigma]